MKCKQSILKNMVDFSASQSAPHPKVTRSHRALSHCRFLKPPSLRAAAACLRGWGWGWGFLAG